MCFEGDQRLYIYFRECGGYRYEHKDLIIYDTFHSIAVIIIINAQKILCMSIITFLSEYRYSAVLAKKL